MTNANPQSPSIMSELRQLKELIDETNVSLRSQRDILTTRGFNLPPMVLKAVESLKTDIEALESGILDDQTELGQLRTIADTSALINSTLDINEVFNQAMDVIISLTNAERGFIIIINSETQKLDVRIQRDNGLMPKQGSSSAPQLSTTVLKEVLDTGEPLLADNAYKDDRLQGGMSIAQLSLRSVLCVPLLYKSKIIGVVYVDNRLRAGVFTEREKNLLAAFANQASVAIENASLYKRIQKALIEISEMKTLMDNVFASIGSGVITSDAINRIITFNRAAEEILSKESVNVLGKPLGDVLTGVSADLDNHLQEVRLNDRQQTIEAELQVPNRGRVALSMKLSPLKGSDDNESAHGVAMVIDDFTEKRERDQLFSMMRRYLPPQMVDNIHQIAQIDLGGERREVTSVFVDTRSIDTFPPNFRPQQIMESLNSYIACATKPIHDSGGVIDKYMGTEIMVLFNTQLNPITQHAQQAVEMSLAVRDAFVALYNELGISPDPHYYRIGMHTGVATLGNVGSLNRREFSAIGDTINLSKRIEENSVAPQILITEDTYKHIHDNADGNLSHIRFEDCGAIKVKGRQQPIQIYEVFKA